MGVFLSLWLSPFVLSTDNLNGARRYIQVFTQNVPSASININLWPKPPWGISPPPEKKAGGGGGGGGGPKQNFLIFEGP